MNTTATASPPGPAATNQNTPFEPTVKTKVISWDTAALSLAGLGLLRDQITSCLATWRGRNVENSSLSADDIGTDVAVQEKDLANVIAAIQELLA